ncbi:MAG: hypothetical protein ACKVKM_08125 [Verrucomicrobiia bacterium]
MPIGRVRVKAGTLLNQRPVARGQASSPSTRTPRAANSRHAAAPIEPTPATITSYAMRAA